MCTVGGALRPKQQQQELLNDLKHISTDVMIGELPRVHSGALQLKQQSKLLTDFNQLSLNQPMLSGDAMLIEELQQSRAQRCTAAQTATTGVADLSLSHIDRGDAR